MALITCKDCQQKFSTDAGRCPHCGARRPISKNLLWAFWGAIAISVFSCSLLPGVPVSTPAPKTAAQIAEEKARAKKCEVQLLPYISAEGFFVGPMKGRVPYAVLVGPRFYAASYGQKQQAAEILNCTLLQGERGQTDFDFVDWQSGKTVGRYHFGKVEMD